MATQADFDRIGNYARMYNKDQDIDRRHSKRVVPLEVLALGYSRTGTLSMRMAFEILGYASPYHFSSFYDNVRDCDIWRDLIDKKYHGKAGPPISKADFDGLLGHCGAVTDMPCHLFAAELIEFYPDAKIVLVERDIDAWSKSWSHFLDNAFNPVLPFLARFDPYWMGRIVGTGVAGTHIQVGREKTLAGAKAKSREVYQEHYALVRSLVPKDRILEYRMGDGWGPLCEFLGKPVPDVEFPHENDTAKNSQGFKELAILGLKHIAWNGAKLVSVVGALAFAYITLRP